MLTMRPAARPMVAPTPSSDVMNDKHIDPKNRMNTKNQVSITMRPVEVARIRVGPLIPALTNRIAIISESSIAKQAALVETLVDNWLASNNVPKVPSTLTTLENIKAASHAFGAQVPFGTSESPRLNMWAFYRYGAYSDPRSPQISGA